MKTHLKFKLFVLLSLFYAMPAVSQTVVLNPDEFTGPTHIAKEDFPKGNIINMVNGWGGMAVAINEPPAGTDYTPVLKGLKDNLCQVPHWGYLEKGKIRIIDKQKNASLVEAGAVFYMPPGHTVIVDEDAKIIDFSPDQEFKDLYEHVMNRIAEMENSK